MLMLFDVSVAHCCMHMPMLMLCSRTRLDSSFIVYPRVHRHQQGCKAARRQTHVRNTFVWVLALAKDQLYHGVSHRVSSMVLVCRTKGLQHKGENAKLHFHSAPAGASHHLLRGLPPHAQSLPSPLLPYPLWFYARRTSQAFPSHT